MLERNEKIRSAAISFGNSNFLLCCLQKWKWFLAKCVVSPASMAALYKNSIINAEGKVWAVGQKMQI